MEEQSQPPQPHQEHPVSTSAQTAQRNPYALPAAIVFGFALVAAAIFFSGTSTQVGDSGAAAVGAADRNEQEPTTGPIRPIDEDDHIRGNPNAPIVIVEYSDFDCPFCKNFHSTMNQVMSSYGAEGNVAWVYRHFPLEQLHPSAPLIAGSVRVCCRTWRK